MPRRKLPNGPCGKEPKAQGNPTDEETRIMADHAGLVQAYNGQAGDDQWFGHNGYDDLLDGG